MKNLVSIIVPVFNSYKYLDRCLRSIVSQTYKTIEIVLIDDGSTDDSLSICKGYAISDPRIKVLHQDNQGVANARNAGIKACKGDYIAFVDSDDEISPYMIERLLDCLIESRSDISFCAVSMVRNGIEVSIKSSSTSKQLSALDFYRCVFSLIDQKVLAQNGGYLCNKLFKRELFYGKKIPHKIAAEDEFFLLLIANLITRTYYVGEPLYFYHLRQDSISNNSEFALQLTETRSSYADIKCSPGIRATAICAYAKAILWLQYIYKERNQSIIFSREESGQIRYHAIRCLLQLMKSGSIKDIDTRHLTILCFYSCPRMFQVLCFYFYKRFKKFLPFLKRKRKN